MRPTPAVRSSAATGKCTSTTSTPSSSSRKLSYLLDKDALAGVDVSIHPPFTDLRSVQTLLDADRIPSPSAPRTATGRRRAPSPARAPVFLAKLAVATRPPATASGGSCSARHDEMVARKVVAIQANGMTPILCVGETLAEREAGGTEAKVVGQVRRRPR